MLACVHGLATPRPGRCRSAVSRYVQNDDLRPATRACAAVPPCAYPGELSSGRPSPREAAHRAC